MAAHHDATIGTGADIVSVRRVDRLIDRAGDRFVRRWFTSAEIAYCGSMARPSLHYAARLAAKEAVVKTLGVAAEGPLPWRSVEIVGGGGAPTVRLSGAPADAAARRGIGRIHLSISHCDEYAVAVAVASTAGDGG